MNHQATIFKALQILIEKHEHIFIYQHNYPDGDCLGAQFGLQALLQTNYPKKKIYAVGDHQNLYPFLPKHNQRLFLLDDSQFTNSLAIVVDGDSINRISYSHHLFPKCLFTTLIRIDHHNTKANLAYQYEWVDSTYTSVCEQLCDLAINLNWKINALGANFLYLGISTDSGRMAFDKVKARTFRILSWLAKNEAAIFKINMHLSTKSLNFTRFMAVVWSNYVNDGGFIYYVVHQSIIKKYDLNVIEANDANLLGHIKESKVWAFFVELEDQRYRIRLRSQTFSVEKMLVKFGASGGHKFSTAMVVNLNQIPAVIDHIKRWIKDPEYVKRWTN